MQTCRAMPCLQPEQILPMLLLLAAYQLIKAESVIPTQPCYNSEAALMPGCTKALEILAG